MIQFTTLLSACLVLAMTVQTENQGFPSDYIAHAFDFPIGKPDAKGYYNAQGFTVNNHLGDDWNGTGGGNSDLGDPIYAVAHGKVKFAKNAGLGWGNVIRIIHEMPDGKQIESVYAHCKSMKVAQGDWVKKGEQIATIGNADGVYLAHLHLEIRDDVNMPLGGGYLSETAGFFDPTAFIKLHQTAQ